MGQPFKNLAQMCFVTCHAHFFKPYAYIINYRYIIVDFSLKSGLHTHTIYTYLKDEAMLNVSVCGVFISFIYYGYTKFAASVSKY